MGARENSADTATSELPAQFAEIVGSSSLPFNDEIVVTATTAPTAAECSAPEPPTMTGWPPAWMVRRQRLLDRAEERWFPREPTVRGEWDGEAVSVEWNRRACLDTAVRLLVRVLSRHHDAEVSRVAVNYRFVPGKTALPECSATDFARELAEFLVIPSLDVLVLELPEIGASYVATTEGSAARGWLAVHLPEFDPEVLRAAVKELGSEVPERIIGPA